MTNALPQICLALLTLTFGSAAEELLPKALGVGFPVLLAATWHFADVRASRRSAEEVRLAFPLLFALAAGGVEDSLASLPVMTSASFFAGVVLLMRAVALPRVATLLVYPAYQVWIHVWATNLWGNVFARILVAAPIGLATAFGVGLLLDWAGRKAAVNEQG